MRVLALLVAVLCVAPVSGFAAPDDPVMVEIPPANAGDAFVPGVRLVADLEQDYVEEEYLVSGTASLYNYAHAPAQGPTDIVSIQDDVPYKTRMIVRRPANHGKFKGTVVIEWWNSTAGFDSAPVWDPSAEYFAREGIVYVGVTNANQALGFLVGGCSLFGFLPPTCGTRYADLSLPDDGLAYEMMSQIANLLKSNSAENPLPKQFKVERVFQTGQSQQGGSVIRYASSFHAEGINDGYFVQGNISGRRINAGPICGGGGSPPYPGCTPTLQGTDRLVSTDLPVPVVQALTETDVAELFGIGGRQPETDTFRYYETAGTAHLTVHVGIEVIPAGLLGPDPVLLSDLCQNEINSLADGPVFGSYLYNAMWSNLEKQVAKGRLPPDGAILDTDSNGVVGRDVYGNALGGVRLPALDVPIAAYNPPTNEADPNLPPFLQSIGNLACFLGGSTTPFDKATLDALYPNKGSYVNPVVHAANALAKARLLLPKDRQKIVFRAVGSTIGCGIGFELVLVLPPIVWLRRRRRG